MQTPAVVVMNITRRSHPVCAPAVEARIIELAEEGGAGVKPA